MACVINTVRVIAERFSDFRGFSYRRVILPKMEHGVGFIAELLQKRQRNAVFVDGAGRGTSRIDAERRYAVANAVTRPFERFAHAGSQRFEVIQRMLAEHVLFRILIQALQPARITGDGLCDLFAAEGVHD